MIEIQIISPLLVYWGQDVFCVSGFWNIFIYAMRYLREGTQVYTKFSYVSYKHIHIP